VGGRNPDVELEVDDGPAGSREAGGAPDPTAPDANSSTGTTPSDVHVGRVEGQDVGYAGETGAERRARAGGAGGGSGAGAAGGADEDAAPA
jgi:hypothetical protein